MTAKLAWDVARAGGLVAWVLLCMAVIWGLLLASRLLAGRPTPAWLLDMHRFLGGLAVIFTVVHVAGLVADNYLTFGPAEVLVPFASSWHRSTVAMGVIAMYLLAAIEATSLLKRWLPQRVWRGVHRSSFPLFWLASMHGALAGTDTTAPVYRYGSAAIIAIVLVLIAVRVTIGRRAVRPRRATPRTPPPTPPSPSAKPHQGAVLVDHGAGRTDTR